MDEQRHYPPRLYAEGQSNLEDKDLNHCVLLGQMDTLRISVGETVWNEIKEHPTGIAAKIYEKAIVWSAKTVHYMLCRQLRVRKNEIWFLIGGKPIRFGLNEFEHVTGLTTYPVPTESFEPVVDYRAFLRELVPGSVEGGLPVAPTYYELVDGLGKCREWEPQDIRRKWMGRLFLLAIGIYGLHHNSRIPLDSAKRAFDDEAWNNYPWGRVAFQSLIGSIKTICPIGRTYTVNGLVYVLQAWAYESITCFGELFGKPSDGDMIPLLRWQGNRTRRDLGAVIDEEIEKKGQVRVRHMIENARGLYPEWHDEPVDPELDNLIQDLSDGRFVQGFWDEKVPENLIENKKKKKKKPAPELDDSHHISKKHKVLKENDVVFDESVGNKNDEGKNFNEAADNVSLRRLIMDMVAKFSSRFDNLDTSMNGISSRLENVESEVTELKSEVTELKSEVTELKSQVTELNKWKDSNLFRIKDLLGFRKASTHREGRVNASTDGKGPDDLFPPSTAASIHPLGKDAKSPENVQKSPNTNKEAADTDTDDLIEVVDAKDDGKKKEKPAELARSPFYLRSKKKNNTVVNVKEEEKTKTKTGVNVKEEKNTKTKSVNTKDSKKAKADANKALKDKQALDGKRKRGRPPKPKNGEAAKADDVHDILDEPQKILGEKAGDDEPQKKLGEKGGDVDGGTYNDEEEVAESTVDVDAMIPDYEDDDLAEQIRLSLIRDIRNQTVNLSVKGDDTSKLKDKPTGFFPRIRDDGLTCMRKHCEPSSAIYDPMSPVDPDRLTKLNEHISSTLKGKKLGKCEDPLEFYRLIITPRTIWPDTDKTWGWLNESHISAYQRVLRGRLFTDPCPYHTKGIAFVDQYFTTSMVNDYAQFKKCPKKFKFNGTEYEAVVKGLFPEDQKTLMTWLNDVWHVYFVVQSGGNHWLALDVDLVRGHIDCYDSIYDPNKEKQVLQACKPFREMIPYMVNDTLSVRHYAHKQFTFTWRSPKNVPQNENPGDCGVYALKYIECLALGVTFDGLCDANIQGLRLKMAADILAEQPDIYAGFIN